MKTLVTGANGFLGSWLTKRLLSEGHDVYALVRQNSDLSELQNAKPNYIYGDVTDKKSLDIATDLVDTVFHLAGVVAYKKSERPLMDLVNVQGTQNIVDICVQKNIKLLHLSSVVAIGSSFQKEILNENSEYKISKLNLGYFETKHFAEKIVFDAVKNQNLKAICVNPSTIYGFGDAKKGSRKTQVKVARGEFPFYTSGGVNVVAVEDVIDGIMLALQKGQIGQRYILSSENMTIQNLFQKISQFAKVKPPTIYMPNTALHTIGLTADILHGLGIKIGLSQENAYTATMYHWFSHQKATNDLGYQPKSADIAIENSVRWMKDNGYLK